MESIETRKIVKVGAKSLAISIPKRWAQNIGIEPGDSVDLVLNKDGTITIKPHKLSIKIEAVNALKINVSNYGSDELAKLIEGSYIDGYDTIILEKISDSETITSLLSNLALKLPGMVVFSEGDTVTIKIALSDSIIRFDEVFQRMVNVLTAMFENVDRFLRTGREEHVKKVLLLDDELDRMYFLGLRLINRRLLTSTDVYKEFKEAIDLALTIKFIEIIGDCIDRSVRILIANPNLREEYGSLLTKLYLTAMKLALDSVYIHRSSNIRTVVKVLKRKSEYIWEVRKLRDELASKASPIVGVLVELEMIADLIADLMEIASMKCARSIEK